MAMVIQKMKNLVGLLFVLSVAAMVVGCSTSGGIEVTGSNGAQSVKGANVALTVGSVNSDGNDVATQLRGQVATRLLGAGLFKSISDSSDKTVDYQILIQLTEIDEVSGVSRVMLGVIAGSNKLAGDVRVIDQKTGQTVRSFTFIGESASHPFSGKSDIQDAINIAADEIIKGLG